MINTSFYQCSYEKKAKLALLSDIHDSDWRDIISVFSHWNPEYIFISGDLCEGHLSLSEHSDKYKIKMNSKNMTDFLRFCSSVAPTFYCRGNSEWRFDEADEKVIDECGVYYLDNNWIRYDGFTIGGLTSANCNRKFISQYDNYNPKNSSPSLVWLDEFEKQRGIKLLICHHPEYYSKYLKNRKIDLILSGHAHGGQIRLFNRGLYAQGQGLFPKYTKGIYDNRLIVSAGMSNTCRFLPRIGNPMEIVLVDV